MSDALRQQLLAAHDDVFDGLLAATEGLDAAGWATATGCPGWDVHDQLAHAIGIERMMLGDAPPEVEVPELPHLQREMQWHVERDVEARRGVPGDELRAEAEDVFARRRDALAAMTVADLDAELDSPIGRMAARRVLRTRVFDLTCHEQDVRRALGRPAALTGPRADIALEQVLRAWAATVPGRLQRGGAVAVDVTGWGRRVLDLDAGRLGAEGTAPATLRLAPEQLLALGGGRSDAPAADALTVEGDHDLVRDLVAHAAITP